MIAPSGQQPTISGALIVPMVVVVSGVVGDRTALAGVLLELVGKGGVGAVQDSRVHVVVSGDIGDVPPALRGAIVTGDAFRLTHFNTSDSSWA